MPRGGKRTGSGRPTLLDFWKRLEIGIECDRLARDCLDAKAAEKEARLFDPVEQKENQKAIDDLPAADWKGRNARVLAVELSYRKVIPVDGFPECILKAAEALRYNRDVLWNYEASRSSNLGKLRRNVRIRRPYRYRTEVIRNVSAWATKRFGVPVSERYVKACWIAYRTAF